MTTPVFLFENIFILFIRRIKYILQLFILNFKIWYFESDLIALALALNYLLIEQCLWHQLEQSFNRSIPSYRKSFISFSLSISKNSSVKPIKFILKYLLPRSLKISKFLCFLASSPKAQILWIKLNLLKFSGSIGLRITQVLISK